MKTTLLVLGLALSGCATNGVYVEEITADGGSLVVRQQTRSTWGAKTQEGAGNFHYEATDPEGGGFVMSAGATVKGQAAGDPVQSLVGFAKLLRELSGVLYGPPAAVQTEAQGNEQDSQDDTHEDALEGIDPPE